MPLAGEVGRGDRAGGGAGAGEARALYSEVQCIMGMATGFQC